MFMCLMSCMASYAFLFRLDVHGSFYEPRDLFCIHVNNLYDMNVLFVVVCVCLSILFDTFHVVWFGLWRVVCGVLRLWHTSSPGPTSPRRTLCPPCVHPLG